MIPVLALACVGVVADPVGPPPEGRAVATFAGGCFWCVEEAFDPVDGVERTTSGYTGGDVADPSYYEVAGSDTGHAEAVRIVYDPERVSYRELLDVFWHNIDPTQSNRQFCDRGPEYRSAIFYHGDEQRQLAEQTRDRIAASGVLPGPIMTEIESAGPFYAAEERHQNYYQKNPERYMFYKASCGREARLRQIWADESG
ncbi:MAG: peptide-methionine (S)-S-oxide reductase MsrA [Halofilum sp. (in: g-proteobacteria)]